MKKVITVDELREYTNFMEEDPQNLLEGYLNAAEDIVTDYLGYDPVIQDRDEWVSGTGDTKLHLRAKPIVGVYYISVDGKEDLCHQFVFQDEFIYDPERKYKFPEGVENIHVKYTAGYNKLPQVIRIAVLRIAALMASEANGNIGVTSKSYGDQSRTFISYNNYDKYLRPIRAYRIINFGV